MRTNKWALQVSRTIMESDIWYKPPDWFKIWIHILLNVNFWDTNQFKRWTNFFQYDFIALSCWCSINTVNNCIKFLKGAEQIQNRKTPRGAIITVINYDKYQDLSNYGRTSTKTGMGTGTITTMDTIKEEGKQWKECKKWKELYKPWKVKLFEEESFEYSISKFFLDSLISRGVASVLYQLKKKSEETIIISWAWVVSKIINIDKLTPEQLRYIIEFTIQDDFWSTVILSMEKFRKKNKEWIPYLIVIIWKMKEFQGNRKLTQEDKENMSLEELRAYRRKKGFIK